MNRTKNVDMFCTFKNEKQPILDGETRWEKHGKGPSGRCWPSFFG
jgi:hypothetical protein